MKKTVLLLIVVFLSAPFSSVLAEDKPAIPAPPPLPSAPQKHLPIFMELNTWTGLHFFNEEGEIKGEDNLKKTVNSLHDYKASELWTRSENERSSGLAFSLGGLAFMLGGAAVVGVDPNTRNNPNSIDGQQVAGLVLATVGFVGAFVGLVQMGDAEADQFNSIQRYNIVVYKNCETSWITPKPQVQADLLTFKF